MYEKPIILTNYDLAEGIFLASGDVISGNVTIERQDGYDNIQEVNTTLNDLPVESLPSNTDVIVEFDTNQSDTTVNNGSLPDNCSVVGCSGGKVKVCCPIAYLIRSRCRLELDLCSGITRPRVNRCRWYCR